MSFSTFINKVHSAVKYLIDSPNAGIPLEVFLILTDECNYHCKVCSLWRGLYKDKNENPMSLDEIKSLIDDSSALGIPTFIISGGEPLLHPQLLEIADYATRKMNVVRLNTNASLITETIARELVKAGLHEIWISLDGIGEYYDNFRGVKDAYARTVSGLQKIHAEKIKQNSRLPRILIDTIVTEENKSSLPEFVGILKGFGVDEVNLVHTCYVSPESVKETEKVLGKENIYSGQFTTEAGSKALGVRLSQSLVSEIRKAESDGPGIYVDPLLLAPEEETRGLCRCIIPWTNMMVFSSGNVCACVLLDSIIIGNVKNQSIMDIWNGETMREIRRKAHNGFPVCNYCICTRRVPSDHLKHRQTLRRVFS